MTKHVLLTMGSISDWDQMQHAAEMMDKIGVTYDKTIISAHRMPDEMFESAENAKDNGYQLIIAGAGGAAHLPGMLAAKTTLPVIGVPIKSSTLNGIDSLLSIVQMPAGVPVATMAIGKAGAKNAALLAGRIIGINETTIEQNLIDFKQEQKQQSLESREELND